MFDISRKFKDVLVLDDVIYPLDLSFDNVLRHLEMLHDERFLPELQPFMALKILLKTNTAEEVEAVANLLSQLDIETVLEIYKQISDEHIIIKSERGEVQEYDLAGNLIEKASKQVDDDDEDEEEDKQPLFSLKYDGDYIYSSFMQAYQIDLIEVQGQLHWQKFNALLNSLPSNTKFAEVLKIRAWKPQKDDSSEYINKMRELQEEYALPNEIDY